MNVGLLGTGAIANKHAQAYRNIGFVVAACWNRTEARGREFAERWNTTFVADYRELCRYPELDYVDICTFPNFHLEPVEICAAVKRPVMLQKPIATNLETARKIVGRAWQAGITLGVMSQHRFDDATIFLKRAIEAGRLGKLLEADAYVKWFRSNEYYARAGKGSWQNEGGGALINQAIHQADILLHLAGPVSTVIGMWQLGARHKIEAEDIVNALMRYESGATGSIQASTAFWPGFTERIEIHGTKGSAVISGDRLTGWQVREDEEANSADPAPVEQETMSGSSDPMAINVRSFERQFLDFAAAIREKREPSVNGAAGYRALELVMGIYESCREQKPVSL